MKFLLFILLLFCSVCNAQFIPFPFLGGADIIPREPKVFYVKANGDNSLSGLDTTNAWQTLDRLRYTIFVAGDTIRFKGGDIITGSGSIEYPIILDGDYTKLVCNSYGTGNATLRLDSGDAQVLKVIYQSRMRIEFKHLIFKGYFNPTTHLGGNAQEAGIYIVNTSNTNTIDSNNIKIDSCEFKELRNCGIRITMNSNYKRGSLYITHNNFHDLANGIFITGLIYWNAHIDDNSLVNLTSDDLYTISSPTGTGVGMTYCKGIMLERNYLNGMSLGLYSSICRNQTYGHNEVRNIYRENTILAEGIYPEGIGLYLDCGTDSSLIEYNYVQNCQGHGIELMPATSGFCGFPGSSIPGFEEDSSGSYANIARFNIVKVDSGGRAGIGGYNGWRLPIRSPLIYNNLIYVKKGRKSNNYATSTFDTIYNRLFPPAGIEIFGNAESLYVYNNIFILDSAVALRIDTTVSGLVENLDSSNHWVTFKGIQYNNFHNNIYYSVRREEPIIVQQRKGFFYDGTIFYWKYYNTTLKNWADSTGNEKNGGNYTYITYNPYVKNIRAVYNRINQYYLDTLSEMKTLDASFASGGYGVNYNSVVRRFKDTVAVDFYGNALSSSNINLGVYKNPDTYTYQIETLRWLGRDTAMSDGERISQTRRRKLDTAIVKQLKDNNIWDTIRVAYLFANEKEYFTTLNIKSDSFSINYVNGFSWGIDQGVVPDGGSYMDTHYNIYDDALITSSRIGANVYVMDDISDADIFTFGVSFDNADDSIVYFGINPLNRDGVAEFYTCDNDYGASAFLDGTSLGMFYIGRLPSVGGKVVYQNGGALFGFESNTFRFKPNGSVYIFAVHNVKTGYAEKYSDRKLGWFDVNLSLSVGKIGIHNAIIERYMDYLGIGVEE